MESVLKAFRREMQGVESVLKACLPTALCEGGEGVQWSWPESL